MMTSTVISHIISVLLGVGIAALVIWLMERLSGMKEECKEQPVSELQPKDYIDETTMATEDDPQWVGWYGISGKEKK
jgi:precorrin-6B methylase 1